MSDKEIGKRMVEEIALENIIDAFTSITGRTITDEGSDGFSKVEGSPDLFFGFDGRALGIEIAEVRDVNDPEGYLGKACDIAWKKQRENV